MSELLSELRKIKDWIDKDSFIIKKDHQDGRVVSLLAESKILEKLSERFDNINVSGVSRSFGDFTIKVRDKEIPVNLKLTSQTNNSNDNLVGMVSIMSHIFFNGKKINSHSSIAKKIKSGDFSSEYNDYGFLSITKETGKCEVSTMINMEGYVVNPSNGFQANFNRIKTVEKSFDDGRKYMLSKYKEYLKKKAEAYLILEDTDV